MYPPIRTAEELSGPPASTRADLERIAAMKSEVWGQDWSWLADDLADRVASNPDHLAVLVAEADEVVRGTAAWLVVMPGTRIAVDYVRWS